MTPNLDSNNPLAAVYGVLTWPFRAIAELLNLPPLPSPFDGDGKAPIVPAPGWTPPALPGGQAAPPPVVPTNLRPAAPTNPYAQEMVRAWDLDRNVWFYITLHQFEFLQAQGGAARWEFAGLVAPGETP